MRQPLCHVFGQSRARYRPRAQRNVVRVGWRCSNRRCNRLYIWAPGCTWRTYCPHMGERRVGVTFARRESYVESSGCSKITVPMGDKR